MKRGQGWKAAAGGLAWMGMGGLVWAQSSWPSYPSSTAISIRNPGGHVGIGLAVPFDPNFGLRGLSVEGENGAELRVQGAGGWWAGQFYAVSWETVLGLVANHPLVLRTNQTEKMRIAARGNVGIGTTNPTYKLSVNGKVGAKDVIVTGSGWSDYVLQPDYRLLPLREVSAFIQKHRHLPGIPTEAEVKRKGVSVGEMQAKLLAKVEELTLHLIEQEKKNEALRERVAQLEARAAGK